MDKKSLECAFEKGADDLISVIRSEDASTCDRVQAIQALFEVTREADGAGALIERFAATKTPEEVGALISRLHAAVARQASEPQVAAVKK